MFSSTVIQCTNEGLHCADMNTVNISHVRERPPFCTFHVFPRKIVKLWQTNDSGPVELPVISHDADMIYSILCTSRPKKSRPGWQTRTSVIEATHAPSVYKNFVRVATYRIPPPITFMIIPWPLCRNRTKPLHWNCTSNPLSYNHIRYSSNFPGHDKSHGFPRTPCLITNHPDLSTFSSRQFQHQTFVGNFLVLQPHTFTCHFPVA